MRYLRYTRPVYVENLAQACVYEYQTVTESADLLDTYLSFNWSYYFSIFISILCFIASWNICAMIGSRIDVSVKNKLRSTRKPAYWLITCSILDEDQFPDIARISFSAISICTFMLLYFFIDCFLLNQISTDLVVVVEPQVVKSYSDILYRDDVKALFVESNDDNKFFSDAKYGSLEHEIWKTKSIMVHAVDSENIQRYQEGILKQRYVGIIRDWVILSAANTMAPIMAKMNNDLLRLYVKSTGQSYDNSCMMRNDIDPRFYVYIDRM